MSHAWFQSSSPAEAWSRLWGVDFKVPSGKIERSFSEDYYADILGIEFLKSDASGELEEDELDELEIADF